MSSTGLNRISTDKFYTKPSIVSLCILEFKRKIKVSKTQDLIIEPSSGNGAFISSIQTLCNNREFYDIAPEHDEVIKQDFLTLDDGNYSTRYTKVHVLTNPPYGRQSCMAKKFIKKASKFADTIAFILPKSFKKDSQKNSFPVNFHLISEIDLPKNAFLIGEKEHDVPSIFQIWVRRKTVRPVEDVLEPIGFSFVKKEENPDISVRRVGFYAGSIDIDINKSIQSHYFIKFDMDMEDDLLLELSKITFDVDNTVGPRSVSKQELMAKYNPVLGRFKSREK
jgi:hypothetical protein